MHRSTRGSGLRWLLLLLVGAWLGWPGPARGDTTRPTATITACSEAALTSALAAGGTIILDCTAASAVIPITSEKLITNETVIDGRGHVTLRGNGATRLLKTSNNVRLTIRDLILENGMTGGQGGAIEVGFWNRLWISGSTFRNNVATKDTVACDGGGALFIGGGSVASIVGSVFSGNRANNGGAINNLRTDLSVYDSVFEGNQAIHTDRINSFGDCGGGGAIYIDGAKKRSEGGSGELLIRSSRFVGNTTNNHGGAIFSYLYEHNTLTIDRARFDGNRANNAASLASAGTGGAIWHSRLTSGAEAATGKLYLARSTLSNNRAESSGGGLWTDAPAIITSSTFIGNDATNPASLAPDDWRRGFGGAIVGCAGVEIASSTIAGNRAGFVGGAIAAAGSNGRSALLIRNTIIANNVANNPWQIQQQCTNQLTDGGNNLQFPNRQTSNWNDYVCSAQSPIVDPRLGALGEHGGPTPTIALLSGSPAIDAGNPASCPALDQRGFFRSARCDIGAYEFGGATFSPTHSVALPWAGR